MTENLSAESSNKEGCNTSEENKLYTSKVIGAEAKLMLRENTQTQAQREKSCRSAVQPCYSCIS